MFRVLRAQPNPLRFGATRAISLFFILLLALGTHSTLMLVVMHSALLPPPRITFVVLLPRLLAVVPWLSSSMPNTLSLPISHPACMSIVFSFAILLVVSTLLILSKPTMESLLLPVSSKLSANMSFLLAIPIGSVFGEC